jgi:hypothetical protein
VYVRPKRSMSAMNRIRWEGAARAGLQVFRLKRPEMTLNELVESLSSDQPTQPRVLSYGSEKYSADW